MEAPDATVPHVAVVASVTSALPALPVWLGSNAASASAAVIAPVPPLAMAVTPPALNPAGSSTPTVIHALLDPLRTFHTGGLLLVSTHGWKATVTVGALLPLLWLNSAARLSLMSARTLGNVAFWTD
jgi:hypothetical protein